MGGPEYFGELVPIAVRDEGVLLWDIEEVAILEVIDHLTAPSECFCGSSHSTVSDKEEPDEPWG